MARKTAVSTVPQAIRVALYTRVSTDMQASKEEGSLETQEARLRAAVLSRAGEHEVRYVFREEGESGKSLDRPALQKLLAHARRGDIDLILVTRIDRLSRSLLDFYTMHQLFEKHQVQFVSLNETFDTSSAVGRAMLKLVLVFAELEREQTAERTRLAIQARAERGLWNGGPPPLGYNSLRGGHLEVNLEEAEQVRAIFGKYLELRSAHKVAAWLNAQGFRQKLYTSRRRGDTGGKDFNISVVRHILQSRLYLGEIEHKGAIFKGQHQALIDRDLYDRVQGIMTSNTLVPTAAREWAQYDYLLTGLVRCSCGHALTSSSGKGNGGNYYYYRCTGIQKWVEHKCEVRQVRAERVDEAVMSLLRDAAHQPSLIMEAIAEANAMARQTVKPLEERVQTLKRELAEAERRAGEVLSSILSSGVGRTATAKRLLLETELRQDQLRTALGVAEGELLAKSTQQLDLEVVVDVLRTLDESFVTLSLAEKREFLGHIFKGVTVYPNRVEVELYEGRQAIKLLEGAKGRGEEGKKEKSPGRRPVERSTEAPQNPSSQTMVNTVCLDAVNAPPP